MRTLAIGDIHGCDNALEAVLAVARVTPEDSLIFLGDYIDRGPQSKAVVSRVIELSQQQQVIALRGQSRGHDPCRTGRRFAVQSLVFLRR